jgi:hypothetical protein
MLSADAYSKASLFPIYIVSRMITLLTNHFVAVPIGHGSAHNALAESRGCRAFANERLVPQMWMEGLVTLFG